MRIREHRGGLAESLETTEEISQTKKAVVDHITDILSRYDVIVDSTTVHIKKYGDGIDARCGWDTHIVTIDSYGVFGMTDGPVDA